MSSIQQSTGIHLSKVFKEPRHWDKDARSCRQPGTQSELLRFTAHTALIRQLLLLRQEVRRVQTRTAYCPRCPNTGRDPALLLQPVADVPPTLTRAGLQPQYFSRTVSIKWSGSHGLLGTAWWNPAAHAPQQAHCHHFAGHGLKSTCCLRAAGVKMPARRADTVPRKHCRSSFFCQHISWLIIFVWAPKTHSWLYVKQHTPQSNSKI